MKKWMYLIFPSIMLAGFMVIYFSHAKEAQEKEARHVAQVAKERAEAEEKKKAAEAKAREDAKKRQEERDAEEKKKEDEKLAKQAADDKKVHDATLEYIAKGNAAAAEVAKLEAELDRLRKLKDKTTRESFDLAKQVELARIARRNAELEIQRMTEMVVRRASDSSLTRPPAIPAMPEKT
jgi:ABC-type Na+ efflux pump permease subunit